MINELIFQMIFDEYKKYLPTEWERLVTYFEYGEASYTFSFYVKENGVYTKCFDIPQVTEEELLESFRIIDGFLINEQKESGWTNFTMTVDSEGNMHSDFDYTDLSSGTYQYHKNWKKKYLI